jgi:hypothetical protein
VTGDLSPFTSVSFLINLSKTDDVNAHALRTAAIATFSSNAYFEVLAIVECGLKSVAGMSDEMRFLRARNIRE